MKKCPICNSPNYDIISCLCSNMKILGSDFPEGDTNVVSCKECGLVYLQSDATQKNYLNYYTEISKPVEYYKMFEKEDTDVYFNRILEIVKPYINENSSIMDFGSGVGELGLYIKENGHFNKVTALDPKEQCINKCIESGLETIKCSSLDILENVHDKYDLIIMNHILEHILDLNQTLTDIKQILNENGYIYIENPDIEKYTENKDKNTPYSFLTYEHVLHMGMEDLKNLALCTGYEIIESGKYFKKTSNYPTIWGVLKPIDKKDFIIKCTDGQQFIKSYINECKKNIKKSLEEYKLSQTKLILWGIGASTAILLDDFAECNIIQLIDSNPMRQGINYRIGNNNFKIQAPSEVVDSEASIFIMSGPYKEAISNYIKSMGLKNTIISFEN